MKNKNIWFFPKRNDGHWSSMREVVLATNGNIAFELRLFKHCLKANRFIFADGDSLSVPRLLLIFLLSVLCPVELMIIRPDSTVNSTLRHRLKKFVFIVLSKLNRISLTGICYGKIADCYYKGILNYNIYDFQMFDMAYLKFSIEARKERENSIFIGGNLSKDKESRVITDLIRSKSFKYFIISDTSFDIDEISIPSGVVVEHRKCPNELDFISAMLECDTVYCYYPETTMRSSGIFGRALQFEKSVLIRENGFLDLNYCYDNKLYFAGDIVFSKPESEGKIDYVREGIMKWENRYK